MKQFNYFYFLKTTFHASKTVASGLLFLKIMSSIMQSVLILVLAEFINCVYSIFNNGVNGKIYIITVIVEYVLLQLFIWIEPNISELLNAHLLVNMRKYYNGIILDKYTKLRYEHIENKSTLDLLDRVVQNAEKQLVDCYQSYLNIISFIVKTAGLIIVLANEAILPAIVIVICAIPLLFLAVKGGRASYETAKEVTNCERKANYLSEIMLDRIYVYERKLFNYGWNINTQWREEYEIARKLKLKTSIKWYIKNKIGSILTAIIAVISSIVLIEPVFNKSLSVGLYISLVGAIYALVKTMAWEFTQNVDSLTTTGEYIKDFNVFYTLDEISVEQATKTTNIEFRTLEFSHVYFKYPNTDTYILNDLCLKMVEGKQYYIVGINGSGKTTIIKLLLGLYDQYEGRILLNDKNLKKYSNAQIQSICTVVFQDFARYALTIRENILLGCLKRVTEIREQEIDQVLNDVGLKETINQYENGLDTPLGSNFKNGQDFSVGQWQRLAIARSLIGNSQLTFFDEPTASLDPIAENLFYQTIQLVGQKRTIVVISHRLAITKNADCIFVIDKGKVSEFGNFEQLIATGREFAHMYESQKRWYDDEK